MKTILFLFLFAHTPFEWEKHKISWDDFQGIQDMPTLASASSCTELSMTMSKDSLGGVVFKVDAIFHPEKSFVTTECSRSAFALNHEQLHFDITEIYARRLRSLLEPFQHTTKQADVEIAGYFYELIEKEWNQCEEIYDRETVHSQNRWQQSQWGQTIRKCLEKSDKNVNKLGPRLRPIRRQQRAH